MLPGASFPQGPNQLAYAAAALLSKKPVYGLHLDMALRMTQGYDVAYANAFCDFLYVSLGEVADFGSEQNHIVTNHPWGGSNVSLP